MSWGAIVWSGSGGRVEEDTGHRAGGRTWPEVPHRLEYGATEQRQSDRYQSSKRLTPYLQPVVDIYTHYFSQVLYDYQLEGYILVSRQQSWWAHCHMSQNRQPNPQHHKLKVRFPYIHNQWDNHLHPYIHSTTIIDKHRAMYLHLWAAMKTGFSNVCVRKLQWNYCICWQTGNCILFCFVYCIQVQIYKIFLRWKICELPGRLMSTWRGH